MGPFVGYTEDTVVENLTTLLSKLQSSVCLIEKLHPAESNRKDETMVYHNLQHKVVNHCDLPSLLWHSEIVVGMRSVGLLEAALLGRPTISFQPGLID
jgi:predicted glycosyltransferase